MTDRDTLRKYRYDGYVNLLNKYGSSRDSSEAYSYRHEAQIPDAQLTELYETNGLFAKIIDTPADEALKHGSAFHLNSDELTKFTEAALDDLDWEEKASTAIKWSRLYGGALIVMLIDDGGGLDEPLRWDGIRSIDELCVFERAVVQPDLNSLYSRNIGVGRASVWGKPEYYYVSSIYGSFFVHESRCLVFKNGVLPENTSNSVYRTWGIPEYLRIRREIRETVTAHGYAVKMLERSVQAVHGIKNLSQLLSTDDGEKSVLKRLEAVDLARGLLNTMAIDADGESYEFKTFQLSGVKDVIESACGLLSAVTNIPQTILFGRSPAGMNSTGESDLENWYSFVERIQKRMLKGNLRYLLDVIYQAGKASGEIDAVPEYKVEFGPLWSLSEKEQAQVDGQKAAASLARAQTAQTYVDMQALDPSEVRRELAEDGEYRIDRIEAEQDENWLNDTEDELYGEEDRKINKNDFTSVADGSIINTDEWSEEDHPRDEDGKFAGGGSGSGGSSATSGEAGTSKSSVEAETPKSAVEAETSKSSGKSGGAKNVVTKFRTIGRTMKITSDLSIEASNSGKSTVTIKSGGIIHGIYSFAGKSSDKDLRVSKNLSAQFGGNSSDWSHNAGFADVVNKNGVTEKAEIHWFENDSVGQVLFKVKRFK